jgi:trigger factor
MSYTIEKKDLEAVVKIIIPWKKVKGDFDKLVKQSSKNVSVKGFRKGHVPADVAEKQVDRSRILSQVAENLLGKEYSEAVKKEELKIAGQPAVQMTKLAEKNDIEATLNIPLMPTIELPKNWKKTITKINKDFAKNKIEITNQEVDEELKTLANSRAAHKEVKRAAKDGDAVKVDFVVKQDGVIIENGTSTDHSLVLGKGVFIPGFEEEIIGMKAGEEKKFTLTFPKEYHAKHLAGKEATFEVVLKVVEERIAPKIDDDFAKSLGDKFKTLAELKKNLKEGMQKEKEKNNQEKRNNEYLTSLNQAIKIELPEQMVNDEIQRMMGEFNSQLEMSGMNFDDYVAKLGKTKADFEKQWRPDAEKRVINALLLEELGKVLEIEISSDEIEREMNKTLMQYKGVKDLEKNIDMRQLYGITQGILSNQKVFTELKKM